MLFDEHLLRSMFTEADFKHEGSLGVGPLTGAIQGRYSASLTLPTLRLSHVSSTVCERVLPGSPKESTGRQIG